MGLSPVVIENFPGLDLRPDPGDSRGAIDMLNVTLEPGRVRSREGTSLFYASPATVQFMDVFNSSALGRQLIIGSAGGVNGTYSAVGANAGLLGSTAAATGIIDATGCSGVAIGTPTATAYYITTARGGFIQKWSGAAWSAPGTMPLAPNVLSISPTDNRLVVCDTGSKVWFSDAGAPETFGVNNFVNLTPGDGETIRAAAVFNNQLFIFKSTKYFVFYGTSTDPTGNPVFNYRTVAANLGPQFRQLITPAAVCTGPDGVYFVSGDSVYRTTGGAPINVALPIVPYFAASTGPFWQGGNWSPTSAITPRIGWVGDRMFVSLVPTGGSAGTFVYDRRIDSWYVWGLTPTAVSRFASASADGALDATFFGIGVNAVKVDPALAADQGAAIVSRYRLPFEDYGSPRRKRIRETILEGVGAPLVQWSRDWGALVPGSTVTLGTSPAIADARQRLAIRGNMFSLQLGAASGAWSMNRIQVNLLDEQSGPEIDV